MKIMPSKVDNFKNIKQKCATLTWRGVSVHILEFRRKVCKKVVNNVTGAAKSRELTAILGGSGSGKTSLMTALAFRYQSHLAVQGDIRVNGCLVNSSYMRMNSGYMHQEDVFIESMTVAEHLWFMARMKLGHNFHSDTISSSIQSLLHNVGLASHYNVKIGNANEENILSKGEKKRLAFATEILSDPSILFLDEPTTGQDAYTATILINQLQNFANRGRTVLCTVHQPCSEIFKSFQKIILILDGRIAFIGSINDALLFFSSLGYVCPLSFNPADFFIKTLVTILHKESGNTIDVRHLCNLFLTTNAYKEIELILKLEITTANCIGSTWLVHKPEIITPTIWLKYILLIQRGFKQALREPSIQILRIIQKIVIAVITGFCFFGTIKFDQHGIQAIQGVIFILVSENTFFPIYSTLSVFPQELPQFFREFQAGLYSVHLYYTSRIISLLPGLALEAIIFTSILYWLAGLSAQMKIYGTTLYIVLLTINVSTACGSFFSTAFDSIAESMAYLIPFDYLLMITMGSFIKLSSIPVYMKWIKYLSWLFQSSEALSITHWHDVTNISCYTSVVDFPCITEGTEVLRQHDFSEDNFELDISLMIVIYLSFHALAYIFLLRKCG